MKTPAWINSYELFFTRIYHIFPWKKVYSFVGVNPSWRYFLESQNFLVINVRKKLVLQRNYSLYSQILFILRIFCTVKPPLDAQYYCKIFWSAHCVRIILNGWPKYCTNFNIVSTLLSKIYTIQIIVQYQIIYIHSLI